jgi:hypothetical protein
MKHVVLLFVLPVLIVLTLSGCGSASTTPTVSAAPTVDVSAIQTQTAHDVLAQLTANAPTATPSPAASPIPATTEVKPTETLCQCPALTLSPTYTPELAKTPTLVPTKARSTAPVITKSPIVAATNSPAATGADGKFYAGYASCIGGTDVVHFLSENSPGGIMEAYKIDRYSYTSTRQCEKSFEAKVDALKQVHVCVLSLPEPANDDLAAIRKSTVIALADLVKIREADFANRLCEQYKVVLLDDARVAFENAQKHLQYAQTTLDKYRREHSK